MSERDLSSDPVRVLIVDDHDLFAEALSVLLARDERIEVVGTANDAAAALELVEQKGPDVALVDFRMAGLDGVETSRRMREIRPSTRIILVSGIEERELRERAREAGATAILRKGALHHEVNDAILGAVRES